MIWQLDKCLALSTLTSMIVWHVLLPLVNCHIGKYHYIRPNNLAVLNKKNVSMIAEHSIAVFQANKLKIKIVVPIF